MEHIKYMRIALNEAKKAYRDDEVPIGAVVVKDGIVISKAHNLREKKQSSTAHAEVLAIEKACKKLGSWRLDGCVLYVTLEPCTMCIGASILARVDGVVYGAKDPKGGSLGSLYDISLIKGLNHYPWIVSGVCEEKSASLLKEFFRNKRINKV